LADDGILIPVAAVVRDNANMSKVLIATHSPEDEGNIRLPAWSTQPQRLITDAAGGEEEAETHVETARDQPEYGGTADRDMERSG
jgi:hypothetical protein